MTKLPFASSPRRCRYVNFEQGQNLRREVAIMKFPIRFCCALGVSAAFHVILTKISKRSRNAVQWNGGISK